MEGKLREALRVELAAVQAPGGAAAVEAVSAAEAEEWLARAEAEAAAAERTETLQRVERRCSRGASYRRRRRRCGS